MICKLVTLTEYVDYRVWLHRCSRRLQADALVSDAHHPHHRRSQVQHRQHTKHGGKAAMLNHNTRKPGACDARHDAAAISQPLQHACTAVRHVLQVRMKASLQETRAPAVWQHVFVLGGGAQGQQHKARIAHMRLQLRIQGLGHSQS